MRTLPEFSYLVYNDIPNKGTEENDIVGVLIQKPNSNIYALIIKEEQFLKKDFVYVYEYNLFKFFFRTFSAMYREQDYLYILCNGHFEEVDWKPHVITLNSLHEIVFTIKNKNNTSYKLINSYLSDLLLPFKHDQKNFNLLQNRKSPSFYTFYFYNGELKLIENIGVFF